MSIEIRSLRKKYDEFDVEMSLLVESDEIVVIAGPSGCGKTTSLQMIAGLIHPDSGEVSVDGRLMTDLPAWKRGIGIVFQDLALFPHLSVGGNVGYGPMIAGTARRRRKEIIAECLSAVRLAGYEKRRVDTLSGGRTPTRGHSQGACRRAQSALAGRTVFQLRRSAAPSVPHGISGITHKRGLPMYFRDS